MAEMQTGEVIFGGVGSGLYGMLMFAILGVFLSGLMVGRTPEFLGKKIEAREIKLTVFGTIGVPMIVLVTSALGDRHRRTARSRSTTPGRRAGPRRSTPTRRRPTTTARRSPATRASCSRPTPSSSASRFANVLGGLAMLVGRFLPLLAALAIAGSLAGKRVAPAGAGTFRTDSPTFVVVLVGVVVIVALLTFVPALLLGPVVQGFTDQLF